MNNKMSKKEKIAIGITAGLFVIVAASALTMKLAMNKEKNTVIEVTESEIQKYKDMIGTDMDIKKSLLIMFETYDECKEFIDEHGSKDNPHEQGKGTVPYMPDGYYNIVGKSSLESYFNSVADGEYTKEPIEYSGMYCYLKRLGVKSILDSEEELKKIIIQDKEQSRKDE